MDMLFYLTQTAYDEQLEIRVFGTAKALNEQIDEVMSLLQDMQRTREQMFFEGDGNGREEHHHAQSAVQS